MVRAPGPEHARNLVCWARFIMEDSALMRKHMYVNAHQGNCRDCGGTLVEATPHSRLTMCEIRLNLILIGSRISLSAVDLLRATSYLPFTPTTRTVNSSHRSMSLVSGPGRGGNSSTPLPTELQLAIEPHVKYIQSLDSVRPPPVLPVPPLTQHSAKMSSNTGSQNICE